MCLEPFFNALAANDPGSGRRFLGFRVKSPGADLVLFRFDGLTEDGQPKGSGQIFGYNGYNPSGGGTLPVLLSVNNIRNTLLFEVTRDEYQAAESYIDMIREMINLPNAKATNLRDAEGDVISPYYFSRGMGVTLDFERKGHVPIDFSGNPRGNYEQEDTLDFMRASDATPMAAVNCVYLANQIVQEIAGVDVSAIHPEMPRSNSGNHFEQVFMETKRNLLTDNMSSKLTRECMVFDEEGALYAQYKPRAASISHRPLLTN